MGDKFWKFTVYMKRIGDTNGCSTPWNIMLASLST